MKDWYPTKVPTNDSIISVRISTLAGLCLKYLCIRLTPTYNQGSQEGLFSLISCFCLITSLRRKERTRSSLIFFDRYCPSSTFITTYSTHVFAIYLSIFSVRINLCRSLFKIFVHQDHAQHPSQEGLFSLISCFCLITSLRRKERTRSSLIFFDRHCPSLTFITTYSTHTLYLP